jgi:hypothetical protein
MFLDTHTYNELEYAGLWNVVDFLMTGNSDYITTLLNERLNTNNDNEFTTVQKKLNVWVPHQYVYELRKLATTISSNIETSDLPLTLRNDFTHSKITYDTFIKNCIISVINYGGVAAALIPINGQQIVKLIPGKNILGTCIDAFGDLEYIKWFDYEDVYDKDSDVVEQVLVEYTYAKEATNKVILKVIKADTSIKITMSRSDIPVAGTTLDKLNGNKFNGSPYLTSLAVNSLRMMINTVNLAHLLDNVMTPRLIYKGATPIKKLSSSKWQGVNIGINDSLQYLEHSGASLDAAKAQIERNNSDINDICSFITTGDKQKTAYEISQITHASDTLKNFLVDGLLKYLTDLFALLNISAVVVYKEPILPEVEPDKVPDKAPDKAPDKEKQTKQN